MYIDTHAHLNYENKYGDERALMKNIRDAGVDEVIAVGWDLASSRLAKAVATRYEGVYFAAGIHPSDTAKAAESDYDGVEALLSDEKAVAVGEIGLDYHYDDVPRDVQRRVFARQLDLACELGLPAVIHDREAHKDCIDEVLARPALQCVFHSFSGSEESARVLARRGVYMAFNGVVTFKNAEKTRRAAKAVPDELLLVETDCPYLAPHPHRGKRNDSALMRLTIAALAEQRGQTPEYIERITTENALRLFPKILR